MPFQHKVSYFQFLGLMDRDQRFPTCFPLISKVFIIQWGTGTFSYIVQGYLSEELCLHPEEAICGLPQAPAPEKGRPKSAEESKTAAASKLWSF